MTDNLPLVSNKFESHLSNYISDCAVLENSFTFYFLKCFCKSLNKISLTPI